MFEALDKSFDNFYGLTPKTPKDMRARRCHLVGLEQDARQPRLATEADVPTDTKTLKRAEDAAADQVTHGHNCSAEKVDPDLTCLTSFGDDSTEPPALSLLARMTP